MKRLAAAVLILSAVVLSGCSVKEPTPLDNAMKTCVELWDSTDPDKTDSVCREWDTYLSEDEFVELYG